MKDFDMMFDAMLEEMMINEMLDFLNDGVKATTKDLLEQLDEIEALQAAEEVEETTVEVLLDTVAYDEKPQGRKISGITNRLPKNHESVSLMDLAMATACGRSWKASVMSGTTNDTFVASSLVALDIDNKESYTSIDKFLTIDSKYKPCFIYETFSSTDRHNRFRVVYAFDSIIDDYNTMVALYNEVKAQYPGVDIDPSVDPGKILFGGKTLKYFENVINKTPSLDSEKIETKKAQTVANTAHIESVIEENIEITEIEVLENLSVIAEQFVDVQRIDINESYEWINKNIKMTDVLGIKENVRFRCILPDHEDKNPSARIATCGDEQVYMCSCEACGYRLITLLSKVLDMSENKVRKFILENLQISYGSEYQKETKLYVADLLFSVDKVMNQELKDYLCRRKLYQTYKLIIEFVYEHITFESLANDDKIAFFMSQRHLKDRMKNSATPIPGDATRKLTSLCELGLLRRLPDSEIRNDALVKANEEREKLQQKLDKDSLNRIDFYELVDLSPSVITNALSMIKTMKDNGVRQRRNNVNRRINAFGADEVMQNINVQTTVNIKKQNKIQNKLENIITDLLKNKDFFTILELAEAYRKTDKAHITKDKAEQVALDFIPTFIQNNTIKESRINKDTRKKYSIPNEKRYSSNKIIYVKKAN